MRTRLIAAILLVLTGAAPAAEMGHPRLYFNSQELTRLREMRTSGLHAKVWANLQASADWCLTLKPREKWIAPLPLAEDPVYERLYDRFYAIMADLAVTEHLAFAYALSGEEKYGEAARQWTLASCRAWKNEANDAPNGAKAYAVMRLLKGIAVAYDAVHDRFSEAERKEIRDTLVAVGSKYYEGYFTTKPIAAATFCTHHAHVEWSSFGVMALALLGEEPAAQQWLDATVKKFEEHLLPLGMAADGAQVEGSTFWASSMHYRLFFMDALRRVTGKDLFKPFAKYMSGDYALALVAGEHRGEFSDAQQSVIFAPGYSQLDYWSPVLLMLAREYRTPGAQRLALCDHSLGALQRTRYITPHGEQLLFELGGYAYLWLDESAPTDAVDKRLSFQFPSVVQATVRASWEPGALMAGVMKDLVVVHAGGHALLADVPPPPPPPPSTKGAATAPVSTFAIRRLDDGGAVATVISEDDNLQSITLELHRPDGLAIRRLTRNRVRPRAPAADWQWYAQGECERSGPTITWKSGWKLHVTVGTITKWEPDGYEPDMSVGYGKLKLADPAPRKFPLCVISPANGEIMLEIRRQ